MLETGALARDCGGTASVLETDALARDCGGTASVLETDALASDCPEKLLEECSCHAFFPRAFNMEALQKDRGGGDGGGK